MLTPDAPSLAPVALRRAAGVAFRGHAVASGAAHGAHKAAHRLRTAWRLAPLNASSGDAGGGDGRDAAAGPAPPLSGGGGTAADADAADATSTAQPAAKTSTARPPVLSPGVLAAEVASGQLWRVAREGFPRVPWGPTQLVQVLAWSSALAVVGAVSTLQTPQAASLAASELQGEAVRHLGLEALCCCICAAVLYMGLRKSRPRAAGFFSFHLDADVALTVAALAAVVFPLADPLLSQLCLGAEEALGLAGQLPDPGAVFVEQLHECAAAGDARSVAVHVAASAVLGPLWEEVFYRGFFLASMTRVLPLPACVAISSSVFAALHVGPGTVLPVALLSGVCDTLYLRTASLAAPLLFHAAWNAYQVLGIVVLGKDAFV